MKFPRKEDIGWLLAGILLLIPFIWAASHG
jgi:hypothetical protein